MKMSSNSKYSSIQPMKIRFTTENIHLNMLMPPCRVLSLTRADIPADRFLLIQLCALIKCEYWFWKHTNCKSWLPGQRERGEQWENDGHFEGWEENRRNLWTLHLIGTHYHCGKFMQSYFWDFLVRRILHCKLHLKRYTNRQLFAHFDWFSFLVVDRWKRAKSRACNPMLVKLKRGRRTDLFQWKQNQPCVKQRCRSKQQKKWKTRDHHATDAAR